VSPVPVIRYKQLLTVQALAAMRFGLHQIEAASLMGSGFAPQAGRKRTAERKRKKEEKKRF
jgi:hypothetical protein